MNETKEHIIQTSLKLFLKKSYRDVTMKELVEKTGLSKGAFYHYFTSKEELFREIVQFFFSYGLIDYSKMNTNNFHQFLMDYAQTTLDSLQQLANFSSDEIDDNPFNFFFMLFEAVNRFPEFLTIEQEMHEKDIEIWGEVIGNAKQKGEITSKASNERIAEIFLSCIDGMALRMASNKQSDYIKNNIKPTFEILYEGLI